MALSEDERRQLEQIEHDLASSDEPPDLGPSHQPRRWKLPVPAALGTWPAVVLAIVAGLTLAVVAVSLPGTAGVPVAVLGYLLVVTGCHRAVAPLGRMSWHIGPPRGRSRPDPQAA